MDTIMATGVLQSFTVTPPSEHDNYAAWWNSPDVREARTRSLYDDNGDVVGVLECLLQVVDEREPLRRAETLAYNCSTFGITATQAMVNAAGQVKVVKPVIGAIIQMLDVGAEPERLWPIFGKAEVDRELARWSPWRAVVLEVARKGGDVEAVAAAVPKGVPWKRVVSFLRTHGFYYQLRSPARQADDDLNTRIMLAYHEGGRLADVAVRAGTSKKKVAAVVAAIRYRNCHKHLAHLLERAA